jgi:hypothetical protein
MERAGATVATLVRPKKGLTGWRVEADSVLGSKQFKILSAESYPNLNREQCIEVEISDLKGCYAYVFRNHNNELYLSLNEPIKMENGYNLDGKQYTEGYHVPGGVFMKLPEDWFLNVTYDSKPLILNNWIDSQA